MFDSNRLSDECRWILPMTLRKLVRYGLITAGTLLLLSPVADKVFWMYSRSRYSSLASHFDAFRSSANSLTSSNSSDTVRRIFGSPDIASNEEWVYRCQHVTRSRYGFPFCEVLLSGSSDHLDVYEICIYYDSAGRVKTYGTREYTGLIFEKRIPDELNSNSPVGTAPMPPVL
jgi:hypothetical protein